MTMKEEILKVMKEAGRPMSAGEVEKLLKADRKEIDKAFKALKEEGKIVSPVRCKWGTGGIASAQCCCTFQRFVLYMNR